MQQPLALPTQELYFPSMKHLKIVVILKNVVICKSEKMWHFFVQIQHMN